jgi:hypothetical protein
MIRCQKWRIRPDYSRADTTPWEAVFCPTDADAAFYTPTTAATIKIEEIGP